MPIEVSPDDHFPDALRVSAPQAVVDGSEPVRRVRRSTAQGWQFYGSAPDGDTATVSVAALLATDPSLAELATLPPGHIADRDGLGEPWRIRPEPALVASCAGGLVIEDPSDEEIDALLGNVYAGGEDFFILSRPQAPNDEYYAQVALYRGGDFQVEYRDGAATRHFQAVTPSQEEAHAAVVGWARQKPGWRGALRWKSMKF